MVKELLLATILGATLGFIVTGSALGIIKNKPKTSQQITPTPTQIISPSPTNSQDIITPAPTSSLSISTPENESIVSTSKITVEGTAGPSNIIIVKTEKGNYSGTANSDGNFSVQVELEAGINNIQVDSFDENDNQQEQQLMVTFSTAKI